MPTHGDRNHLNKPVLGFLFGINSEQWNRSSKRQAAFQARGQWSEGEESPKFTLAEGKYPEVELSLATK